MSRWRRWAWLPPLAAAVAFVAFVALGSWQLERAGERAATEERITAARDAEPRPLPAAREAIEALAWQPVRVRGRYLGTRQFLLDNRRLDDRLGFAVLAPLVTEDGRTLLVERGWIRAEGREPARAIRAPAAGESATTVEGTLWLPDSGLPIGRALAREAEDWPRVTTRLDFDALGDALGRELEPYVIRLSRPDWSALERRSVEPSFGPARHVGYAVQWFALAAAVLVVTLIVRRRRGQHRDG